MAEQSKAVSWRFMIWAGLADVGLGIGLVVAALTGVLGEGMELMSIAGALMALVGVGLVIWARKNLSKAEDRRGDLN